MADLVEDPDPDAPRTVGVTADVSWPAGQQAGPQRRLTSRSAVVLGASAALVAAVFLSRDASEVPRVASAGDPAPSAESSSADEPPAVPGTGTPVFAGARDVPVTVTLSPGWLVEDVFVSKDGDGYGLAFSHVVNIFSDPCGWELLDPPVGPTVDDLSRALAESTAWEAGEPSDAVVDGYEGTHLTFTLPAYDPQGCRRFGLFRDDEPPYGGGEGNHPHVWALGPQQHNDVWILDVDGRRLVILAATFPTTPLEDVADLEEMVASIRIGPSPRPS